MAHITTSQITLVFSFKASRKADIATSVRITEECHNTSGGAETLLQMQTSAVPLTAPNTTDLKVLPHSLAVPLTVF